jgi:acyl-CoA synthetase (AMP-forming)/AMP-acid ligase II
MMKGYLDDPAATAAAIDEEGFLRTGDIGYFDGNGNVRVTDRKKDIFIVGGFNVYSAEVEQKIAAYPGVSHVAVVGVPDHRLGAVGMAFIVPLEPAEFDSAALIAWCREHMANFKVPRFVEVVPSMPVNAVGKILKYQLRDVGERLVQSSR